MDPKISETNTTLIQLMQQAKYRQAQHARAVRREAAWKEKAQQFEKDVREKECVVLQQAQEIDRLRQRVNPSERRCMNSDSGVPI